IVRRKRSTMKHNSLRLMGRKAVLWVFLLLVLGVTPPAHAELVFNITYDEASITAAGRIHGYTLTDVQNAVHYVANEFSSLFTDPIHVNIRVVAGTTSLGQSNSVIVSVGDYTAMRNALIADNTAHPSADGTTSVASLPVADPTDGGRFVATKAQSK